MIRLFDYLRTLPEMESDILQAVRGVLHSGQLVLGPQTEAFEAEFAEFCGAPYCIAVSSGTAALQLAFMELGLTPEDEVVTVANTCAATLAALRLTGAAPVFCDVSEKDLLMDLDQLDALITPRTRCLVPVHLWGDAVRMDRLMETANKHEIPVVEDCAQAHGTILFGRQVGNFGKMGCFSFYPTKNLGAFGEAGAIITSDEETAARLRSLRVYGYDSNGVSQIDGTNARISEMQAAILRIKLQQLPHWLHKRRKTAALYDSRIKAPGIRLPARSPAVVHSHHQYVIRCRQRSAVRRTLKGAGIQFGIHYPTPLHRMPAYGRLSGVARLALPVTESAAKQILSLPVHESLTRSEAEAVARALNSLQSEND